MTLFELFGTIAFDNQKANEAISDTSSKASGLVPVFSKVGKAAMAAGKVIATGLAAGAAGIVALATASIKGYAEYEQLVGGVETLFGAGGLSIEEYAASVGKTVSEVGEQYNALMASQQAVLDNASIAYKTAGMSANEYMETVTSFSASLLQSLGGNTAKAAEVADMALIDMADNANKMGTSMDMIQNAYQGFAKQNYTMLDNLKLGYGGTQSEMKRLLADAQKISGVKYDISNLNDVYEAIHVIQGEMGITGTTAKEASETISGSFSSAKAALSNLMVGIADGNQNLDALINNCVESGNTALKNVTKLLPSLTKGITGMVKGLSAQLPTIIKALLTSVITGAVALITGLASSLPDIMQIMIDMLPDIINQLAGAFADVFPALLAVVNNLFGQLFDFVSVGLLNTGINFRQIATAAKSAFDMIASYFNDVFTDGGINFQALGEAIGNIFLDLTDTLKNMFVNLAGEIPGLLQNIGHTIRNVWGNAVWPMIQGLFKAVFGVTLPDWNNLFSTIQSEWADTLWPSVQEWFKTQLNIELPSWETIASTISEGWNGTVMPTANQIINALGEKLSGATESVSSAVDTMMQSLKEFTQWCIAHRETIENIAIVVASFGTALVTVNTAVKVWGAVSAAAAAGTSLLAGAVGALTAPVTLTVLAIGALIAAIALCIKYWDQIKEKTAEVAAIIAEKWEAVKTAVNNAFQSVVDWLNKNIAEPIAKFKANVIDPIAKEWKETVSSAIAAAVTAVGDFMGIDLADGWDKVTSAISGAWNTVVGKIKSAINAVKKFFGLGGSTGGAEITITAHGAGAKFAKGGVFTKPTFFDTRLGRTEVGEGGEPEAVAPISVLQGYVAEAVASQNAQLVGALDAIYGALVDLDANMGGHMREALDGTSFSMNKREFARLVKAVE